MQKVTLCKIHEAISPFYTKKATINMQVYKLKECGNVYLISNFKCGQIIMKRQDLS